MPTVCIAKIKIIVTINALQMLIFRLLVMFLLHLFFWFMCVVLIGLMSYDYASDDNVKP